MYTSARKGGFNTSRESPLPLLQLLYAMLKQKSHIEEDMEVSTAGWINVTLYNFWIRWEKELNLYEDIFMV